MGTLGPRQAVRGRNGSPMPSLSSAERGRRVTPATVGTVGQGSGGPTQAVATNKLGTHPVLRNSIFATRSRRNGVTGALADSTFRGRFAQSPLAQERKDHHGRHRHRLGVVVGFVGPLFWPYAYDDFIDYTFWPYAYDTFWPYAFDDVFGGIYGAYAPEEYASDEAYLYAGAPATAYASAERGAPREQAAGGNLQICSGRPAELVKFPIERIREQVAPDQKQQELLDDLKTATSKAVDLLQAACPNELPSTPPGQIAAMRKRVEAMLKAVQVVRPALVSFYQSLNDEQKERFNSLDQNSQAAGNREPDLARLCGLDSGLSASLPVSRIDRTLDLSAGQDEDLKGLTRASAKAHDLLKATCRPDQTLTPTGRLAAMEGRLSAVLQAVDTVQPQLTKFYNSLRDEQKARFDRLSTRPV